jgi:hypothetical protein
MESAARLAALALAAAVAGCGGEDSDESGGGAEKPKDPGTVLSLSVVTKPGEILFDKKKLTAPAGPITIKLRNPTQLGHNVRIQTGDRCCFDEGHRDLGGTRVDVGNVSGRVVLKPGRYFFLCSVGGHWQRGQRGTLVVQG